MIDKLEVRVPAGAKFTPDFADQYREIRSDLDLDPFHPTKHYQTVADLRPYGHELILHEFCQHGAGNHKVELIDTGERSLSGMIREIERVYSVDAMRLEVMRIDLAVDVQGVPVQSLQGVVRVKYKRFAATIGQDQFSDMGKRELQTLYLGKRPNCFRIYNKIAEWQEQYRKLTRTMSSEIPPPTFEEIFGYPEIGTILTRFERQIGGGRVPSRLASIGRLGGADEFNPFEPLEILTNPLPEPSVERYDLVFYLAGMQLRRMIETSGLQLTRSWINKHSKRNGNRILKRFCEFLPGGGCPAFS
ncbi:MAG: hypothetical protein HY651_13140 [Acidobacteria bacterium]|nr:hypothetical protein [Acidobacteriota bacterium]